MRYLELFAGAGGLSMGLEAAGMVPVAHAEIEPHACAVLRHHWPDTDLLGNVTALAGGRRMKRWMRSRYLGVDVVAGGSPCQDLSVAGKRAGLDGARSGLFHKQVRIWKILEAPYFLWENVVGALSSQSGRDFAVVLSTIVGRDLVADGSVRSDRRGKIKWKRAGRAVGPAGVAAWRVLDLQHFGPPQQRRRVFVVGSRTAGVDPAAVLALGEGVCGHPPPRGEKGPRNRAAAVARAAARREAVHADGGQRELFGGPDLDGLTTRALAQSLLEEAALANVVPTVTAKWAKGSGGYAGSETANLVLAAHTDVLPALTSAMASSATGHNRDTHIVAPTLVTTHFAKHVGCNQHVSELEVMIEALGAPRRLTPLECERLMGWPDQWTAVGAREEGSAYQLSDSARYRLCGNGVGAPVAAWIGRQLMEVHGRLPPR